MIEKEMNIGGGDLKERAASSIRHKQKYRSIFEGLKVIGLLTAVLAGATLLAFALMPAGAWIVASTCAALWLICASFVAWFFRDADPDPPDCVAVVLSPSHGTVDYIDDTTETHFLQGPARRISIYLSLLNVHVQHAPSTGEVALLQHFPGRWSRAINRDASLRNEHLLVGLGREDGRKLTVRLISGIWVRRIVPWIARGQPVAAGERIGLIRFGSRVDVFLPVDADVLVKPGDRVRGGTTVLARFPPPEDGNPSS